MGLRARMLDLRIEERRSYDTPSNTVFMNFRGMQVRSAEDVKRIVGAVDAPRGSLVRIRVSGPSSACASP